MSVIVFLKLPAVEKDIQHQIEKLQKRLQVFRPELIHLKGVVEEISPREGTSVSLNLRLPSGQMAVQSKAPTAAAAVKVAFEDLLAASQEAQRPLARFPQMAARTPRQYHAARRSGPRSPLRADDGSCFSSRPFPVTTSAPTSTPICPASIALSSAKFIFARPRTPLLPDSVSKEEVIDEAIAVALSDGQEKPEKLALEPWLYRQALRALDELSRTDESNGNAVHLEDSARRPNVKGSDEPGLQFHQPDESITGATVIADSRVSTPEQILASDELLRLIASSLTRPWRGSARGIHLARGRGIQCGRDRRHHRAASRACPRLRFCRS